VREENVFEVEKVLVREGYKDALAGSDIADGDARGVPGPLRA
jgi:hypothetical protein